MDQTANVSWQINGTEVQFNRDVTGASYTNTSAAIGTWNVSAIVNNANGTDMQSWVWHVTAVPAPTRRGGGSGGTYPPGLFATPTPAVTTTPSPTITPAEASVLEVPAETETSVATPTISATETRAAKPPARKGIPGFEVVFMVAALLAAAYLALRRNN
jgi:PGF-CTERM protein